MRLPLRSMHVPASRWLAPPSVPASASVHAFRLRFWRDQAGPVRLLISADERYVLYLDGKLAGRGPERGDAGEACFDHRELAASKGAHVLVAIVWAAGDVAPLAQVGFQRGFHLRHENPGRETNLSTGLAMWRVKSLAGHRFVDLGERAPEFHAIGVDLEIDGFHHPWGVERGAGDGWLRAEVAPDAPPRFTPFGEQSATRTMRTGALPPMAESRVSGGEIRLAEAGHTKPSRPFNAAGNDATLATAFERLLRQGRGVSLPANGSWRVLIDLTEYHCVYPSIQYTGGAGAVLTLRWAEALHAPGNHRLKGHRDEIEGKSFTGPGDRFICDGGRNRVFTTLWWHAGRYAQLEITTKNEPLRVQALEFHETGYPLKPESRFTTDDSGVATILRLCLRTLRMCAHETYIDCPHYEQLMYVGDTRLEMLTHYTLCRDDHLQRKCIALFAASRDASGMIASRTPSRVRQVIPPFGFWWILSVHDHALWRDQPDFVRAHLPGVRAVVEYGLGHRAPDGLVTGLQGWNFVDWVEGWERGVPPDGDSAGSIINWQFVLALDAAADLEEWHGDRDLAGRCRREAGVLANHLIARFWNAPRGLFADDLLHSRFSEHAQCLAVLSGRLPPSRLNEIRKAFNGADHLARCSLYFSHYWLEACRALELGEAWWRRLKFWRGLAAQGFRTTPEAPEPTRSDCHAWSAHPLFHAHATLLGVRPAAPGFRSVRIAPLGQNNARLNGKVAHPLGMILVEMHVTDQSCELRVQLPAGTNGSFVWNGQEHRLVPGDQTLSLARTPQTAESH